jgi:hypothetical protein
MIARLRWALVKTVWLTAGAAFTLGAYGNAMPRFY